jgi:hypothetical protein
MSRKTPSDEKQWCELGGNEFGPDARWLVRAMDIADYQHVVALWQRSEGVGLGESDTKEGVAAFLLRNPGLSAVAESSHGEIVGAVLAATMADEGTCIIWRSPLPIAGAALPDASSSIPFPVWRTRK